jgi:hypothetical protein
MENNNSKARYYIHYQRNIQHGELISRHYDYGFHFQHMQEFSSSRRAHRAWVTLQTVLRTRVSARQLAEAWKDGSPPYKHLYTIPPPNCDESGNFTF